MAAAASIRPRAALAAQLKPPAASLRPAG